MINLEYREAIVEVLDILKHSEYNIVEKIPKKLIEFWERNKSTTYQPNLDHSKPINEMDLKNKTKSLIAMIYLKYLCDETERRSIELILKRNEEKYQHELKEKYNIDNVFKSKQNSNNLQENEIIVVNNIRKWYSKIFNKILKFLKIK